MKRPAAASHAAKAARARPAAVDSVADSVESSSEPQELSTFSLRLPGLNVRPEFATALCTGFKEIEVRYGSTRLALDALVMSPTSSARRVPQECPTRVSHKSVPQECPIRVSHKRVLQECPTRVSYKSVPEECPTRVSYKSVPQEFPTRVSHKSIPQQCPTRVSHKSVP